MSRPLSPAAREIDQIIGDLYDLPMRDVVAAAIHVLADQAGSARHWHVDQLRAIAAELDGGAATTATPPEAQ